MGSNTFFSKIASFDPLAQALHLPGAGKYMQSQASDAAGKSGGGPYQGVTPTLAGANAGYAPGGPGANQDWKPWVAPQIGNGWQRFAANQGNISPGIVGPLVDKGAPGTNTAYSGNGAQPQNPAAGYVNAARQVAMRQPGLYGNASY